MFPHLGALLVCMTTAVPADGGLAWTHRAVPPSDRIVLAEADMMSIRRRTPNFRGGSSGHLPVGCGYNPDELVRWARTEMPQVQAAIDEFNRRGYRAVPAADTALAGCDGASVVALAFEKAGAFIDSFHVVAPMILVATRLRPVTGEPYTEVTGGIVVGDGEVGLVFSGDSLSAFRATDPSFNIDSRGGSGGRRDRIAATENWLDAVTNPNSRFNQYLRCAGYGTVGCVGGVLAFGGSEFGRIKLAVILAEPQIGLGILGGCLIGSGVGCIGGG